MNWDMVFSLAHEERENAIEYEGICNKMEHYIERTIENSRSLGFTTTPKGHQ